MNKVFEKSDRNMVIADIGNKSYCETKTAGCLKTVDVKATP